MTDPLLGQSPGLRLGLNEQTIAISSFIEPDKINLIFSDSFLAKKALKNVYFCCYLVIVITFITKVKIRFNFWSIIERKATETRVKRWVKGHFFILQISIRPWQQTYYTVEVDHVHVNK